MSSDGQILRRLDHAPEEGAGAAPSHARGAVVLVLGPDLRAVSGVSAHMKTLLGSQLREEFAFIHFQVGSENRVETRIGRWLRLLASPLEFAMTIRRHRPALVHVNTSLNLRAFWRDLAYVIVAKCAGTRVLYQVHGGALPQQFFGRNRLLTAFLRWALALPDTIVVLAESELAAYRRFIPTQRILIVPNAIDNAPYAGLKRTPLPARAPLELLYLGRLAKEKGLDELLHGLATARARGAWVCLTIAGDGPEEARLRRTVEELGLARDVVFTGPVFGARKLRLLVRADVFVLPSYGEGLPYALLEGMAAGAAVITTRVGAIPDVVTPGLHGLFVPPGDATAIASAISMLAADRGRVIRMSTACRSRIAKEYSLEHLVASFRALYSALAAVRPARAGIGS